MTKKNQPSEEEQRVPRDVEELHGDFPFLSAFSSDPEKQQQLQQLNRQHSALAKELFSDSELPELRFQHSLADIEERRELCKHTNTEMERLHREAAQAERQLHQEHFAEKMQDLEQREHALKNPTLPPPPRSFANQRREIELRSLKLQQEYQNRKYTIENIATSLWRKQPKSEK